MRIARYRKSSPDKPDRVRYSITEIKPEEWQEIVIALGGMYTGLATEIHQQMKAVDQTRDIDAAAVGSVPHD